MRCPTSWPTAARHRRGLTLVELLVSIALMLLIMVVIVTVFTAATDAMSGMQKDQELASVARRLEAVITQDLRGATARFTPPLDPADNLGYFEYGENSFADAQDEDTDDYLAFTTKAPPGQPFTGRVMLPRGPIFAPVTITSDTAEVIYFLRHGNLYRRVLLVAPNQTLYRAPGLEGFLIGGEAVGWQGANDISVRPSNSVGAANTEPPIPNSLGDLTNRHNRFARPRFTNDMNGDGIVDDGTQGLPLDGVPDYYPTLYPNNVAYRPTRPARPWDSYDTLAFPFVFPWAYSKGSAFALGEIHEGPLMTYVTRDSSRTRTTINHSPLDVGENLVGDSVYPPREWLVPESEYWTFWGFPTWAETRSPSWTAANKRLAYAEFGIPRFEQSFGLSWQRSLPLKLNPVRPLSQEDILPIQNHWYRDSVGGPNLSPPLNSWQDDLIATNVRSFDVKVLDPNASLYGEVRGINRPPDYYDLGYAGSISETDPRELATLGHEGRIPPLPEDNRIDYLMEQRHGKTNFNEFDLLDYNLGDNSPNTIRLRRVWDTWSTDYASAPAHNIIPGSGPPFFELAPGNRLRMRRPVYPSYPPPYPEPLRGLQIQIRLASPDNQVLKVITIRHDFSDKL